MLRLIAQQDPLSNVYTRLYSDISFRFLTGKSASGKIVQPNSVTQGQDSELSKNMGHSQKEAVAGETCLSQFAKLFAEVGQDKLLKVELREESKSSVNYRLLL